MNIDTLILGNNQIENCIAALVVEGVEVFRLREREHDGQLVVDFDLRDEHGERIAKIAKNHVVFCADGWDTRSKPGLYQVVEQDTGNVLAAVQEISPGTIKVTGVFRVNGYTVIANDDGVVLDGFMVSNVGVSGFGKAITLKKGVVGLGGG